MRPFDPAAPIPPGTTLLEASAGTGKTYSITGIVLRLVVEEALPLEQLLVVTFTEAATAELRDRVRGRLREALAAYAAPDATPDDEVVASLLAASRAAGAVEEHRRRLRNALEEYDRAAISTIHGFCARVLREHAFECGAEFDAELLEDAGELLDEIVHDFWARTVAERPRELVRALLARGLCIRDFRGLAKRVAADPELELVPADPAAAQASPYDAAAAAHAQRLQAAARIWVTSGEEVEATIVGAVGQKILRGQKWASNHRATWLEQMRQWAREPARVAPPECLGRFTTAGLLDSAHEGRAGDVPSHAAFTAGDAVLASMASLEAACADERLLLDHALARYVRAELARRKRARRVHTFDDLLRLVRDALRDPEHGDALTGALRQRYRAALIDEFQDTDGVQWEIFRRVFAVDGHRLVLIGDPKQAIYGFRGADVHAYLAARRVAGEAVLGLTTNRRADRGLVVAVNHLFGRLARPFAEEGIEYPVVNAHHPDRLHDPTRGAPLQLRFLPRPTADGDAPPSPHTKGSVNADVCHLVAADIVRTLRAGATIADDDGARPPRAVSPRDCAVLVRDHYRARDVQRALRRVGVPSVLRGAQSVFLTSEAQELEAVLRAVLEPSNIRLVRTALATDLLGLALADEVAADAPERAAPGIGDALALLDEDERRLERWLDRLAAWSRTWAERGVMPMLRAVMDDLSLPERLLAQEDGERRLTNLRHLGELLHDAAVTRALDGPALVAWLQRQAVRSDVDEDARQLRLESDDDAVQVVTIHASKGLEYPLVWCPYLWDGKLTGGDDDRFVRCRDTVEGVAVRRLDVATGHADRDAHERQRDAGQFAEGLRLLYVALTRARHRCVVHWGIVNDCGGSGLAYLLHGGGDAADAAAALDAARAAEQLDDPAALAALHAIARDSAGTISVVPDAREDVPRWAAAAADRRPLEARRWRRATPLDTAWRIGSFTGMTRGARQHLEHDGEAPEAVADARPARGEPGMDGVPGEDVTAPVPLDVFPSSAKAGILFHELLERHDFTQPAALRPLVQRTLAAHGFDAARWEGPVSAALQGALETPLTAGDAPLRLADVGTGDRLAELRFELPVCGGLAARDGGALTPASLADVLRDHPGGAMPADYAGRVESLGFGALRGFLTGAIDLVVRQGGRWYLLDYKSNHLGPARDDYAATAVAAEMAAAHYHLQYHLYVLALHRYLTWRVPGYDYDRDFGGVLYLFIRGMCPDDGTSRGVYFDRPPRGRVEALDALVAREVPA
ncbi:MAG TPA: exodeoxyribonuclease V subunit beta [Gemmatimonadaceae bacterium]